VPQSTIQLSHVSPAPHTPFPQISVVNEEELLIDELLEELLELLDEEELLELRREEELLLELLEEEELEELLELLEGVGAMSLHVLEHRGLALKS